MLVHYEKKWTLNSSHFINRHFASHAFSALTFSTFQSKKILTGLTELGWFDLISLIGESWSEF